MCACVCVCVCVFRSEASRPSTSCLGGGRKILSMRGTDMGAGSIAKSKLQVGVDMRGER